MNEVFGAPIYSYTRAQALEDGVLVDVTATTKEAGFTVPVALTIDAFNDLVAWNDENQAIQDETGRLWDVLTMARYYSKRGGSTAVCEVLRVPNAPKGRRAKIAKFVMTIGPGDAAEPVITIMLEGED